MSPIPGTRARSASPPAAGTNPEAVDTVEMVPPKVRNKTRGFMALNILEMVLLSGIEPPTPSLPRTCSTPELQQHGRPKGVPGGVAKSAVNLPQTPLKRKVFCRAYTAAA